MICSLHDTSCWLHTVSAEALKLNVPADKMQWPNFPFLFTLQNSHHYILSPQVHMQCCFDLNVNAPVLNMLLCALQLGHVYPRHGAPLSEQIIIDLSQSPQELAAAEGDTYPLIFRLETISEKGLADGHVLEVTFLCICKLWSPLRSYSTFIAATSEQVCCSYVHYDHCTVKL